MNRFNKYFRKVWRLFTNTDEFTDISPAPTGQMHTVNPMRNTSVYTTYGDKSIVTAVTNKIAIDASNMDIMHVRVNERKMYQETIRSPLNECLTIQANTDQTGRAFIKDAIISMFDEGVVALVPTVSDTNILNEPGKIEVYEMRTAKITEWFPRHVRVEIYNDVTGVHTTRKLPKSMVAIVENPLYEIMNRPNSTMKRLIDKLMLLDISDSQTTSTKLDLIIQLPYLLRTESKKQQAAERKAAIEEQLEQSKYGIAYIDGSERITQLNRPVENNLLAQIEFLTKQLYAQLGITEEVFLGTADDKTMLIYYNRTVEPVVTAIVEELRRKFLTKTARTQGQTIMGFRNIFNLITATEIAEMSDSLSRNEIVTPNEFRHYLGMAPDGNPNADVTGNRNMPDRVSGSSEESVSANSTSEYDSLVEELLQGIEDDMLATMEEY